MKCIINETEYEIGEGKSKKDAEQIAAKKTLEFFKII